jgi:hypothetical protein
VYRRSCLLHFTHTPKKARLVRRDFNRKNDASDLTFRHPIYKSGEDAGIGRLNGFYAQHADNDEAFFIRDANSLRPIEVKVRIVIM